MEIKQIILVSGLSGAGKSSIMSILEDIGYLCIDNFPLALLNTLLQWIADNQDARYQYLALSSGARDFDAIYKQLKANEVSYQAVFLEAADDVLIQRYQFTRNRHPYIVSKEASTLQQAINKERNELSGIDDRVIRVDTSNLSIKDLKRIVEANFFKKDEYALSLSFISFGFRYGLPLDADAVFDARFINNPYWQEELRKLSGNDQLVIDYVFADKRTEVLLKRITNYLDFSLKEFVKEQKSHMTVAVGCTGGKHRSVALINYLENYYKESYQVLKLHRDVGRK